MSFPYFISPEQAMNDPDVDIRTDIYSLGATFFAIVTGRLSPAVEPDQRDESDQPDDAVGTGDDAAQIAV